MIVRELITALQDLDPEREIRYSQYDRWHDEPSDAPITGIYVDPFSGYYVLTEHAPGGGV